MKSILPLIFLISVKLTFSQQLTPYNENFYFQLITEHTRLPTIDSLQVLLVGFGGNSTVDFEYTVRNNPQLKEIQLYNPTQAQIDLLSTVPLPELNYLFIEGYGAKQLNIPAFPALTYFRLESTTLQQLNMENAAMDSLEILDVETPVLTTWKVAKNYFKLGLINLKAEQLTTLPFQQLPLLVQCATYCSFDEFPAFLCECKEMTLFSFTNYKVIPVPKCLLVQLKKKGFYSDISLYDGIDGKLVKEHLSPDRKK